MREAVLVVAAVSVALAIVAVVFVAAFLVATWRRRRARLLRDRVVDRGVPEALPPAPPIALLPPAPLDCERDVTTPKTPALVVRRPKTGLTRHPIVLAHGLFGFDGIGPRAARCHYFRGVPERLRELGADLHVLRVAPVSSIASRAGQLAEQIRRLKAERVTVVAHSMGGLDARFAISTLGLAERVACLVTIGTPHRGTPIADLLDGWLVPGMREALGPVGTAIRELSTQRMATYNVEVLDADDVRYASIVGAAREVAPLLAPTHRFLAEHAGDNDGLVPASSQRWGEVLLDVEVDHWGQIGWSRRFDAPALYAGLAITLADRGL